MMNENEDPITAKPLKKEKNPKRVAAGKKGVEARKIKAELKRKESELLKKENIELKAPITRKEIIKDERTKRADSLDETFNTDKININYNLLYLAIGVVGLGLYLYHKPSIYYTTRLDPNKKNVIPVVPKSSIVKQKKEIDPFDF